MKADAIERIATSVYAGQECATLFGDKFHVSDLGLKNVALSEKNW